MKIYADNAATTKLDIDAFEAMKPFMLENYANPSQPYSFSKKAKRAIKEARETIAECINAKPEDIIFTSGGTESDNWAIKCLGLSSTDAKVIATSSIEHHAVLNACKQISSQAEINYLNVNHYGEVDPDEIKKALDFSNRPVCTCMVKLASIMLVNNEIGTIEPIKELSKAAHDMGAYFHTDAVQALGHIPIDVKELNIDMLSASAHKFNGPKGIGFLYKKPKILHPLHNGGSQEFEMRAGTENVPAIVGMAVALKKNVSEMEHHTSHLHSLSTLFLSELRKSGLDFILNGHPINRLPGNINISIKGKSGEGLMHLLDLKGICISTGSACDSVNQQISHVIKAIHVPNEYAEGTIRITFSKDNTEQDAVEIAKALVKITEI